MLKAKAEAHGAISIINAIVGGKGCSLGVGLKVEVEVEISDNCGDLILQIEGVEYTDRDLVLATNVARGILSRLTQDKIGLRIKTNSEIPIARGLKSSSTSSNAMVLATAAALGIGLDDMVAVQCGVGACLDAGVTLTGAFDDACASYFGGYCLTNNIGMKLLRHEKGPADLKVVIYVPYDRFEKKDVDKSTLAIFKPFAEQVFLMADQGRYMEALTMNGLLYSAALGWDPRIATRAISNGAVAAGLSGTGPAVAALCPVNCVETVKELFSQLDGNTIVTDVNNTKARLISY